VTDNTAATLNQRGTFARPRHFELLDNRQVRVTLPSGRRTLAYSLDVLALDPTGRRRFTVSWLWLGVLLGGLLVSWLSLVFLSDLESKVTYFLGLAAGGLIAALGALMFFRSLTRRRVFVSRYAHVPLLDLLVNNPDRKRFREFLNRLEESVKSAHSQYDMPKDQRIAGEMRTLRRLSEQNILSSQDYEQAKAKLLRRY
jgi:hypothetical protein